MEKYELQTNYRILKRDCQTKETKQIFKAVKKETLENMTCFVLEGGTRLCVPKTVYETFSSYFFVSDMENVITGDFLVKEEFLLEHKDMRHPIFRGESAKQTKHAFVFTTGKLYCLFIPRKGGMTCIKDVTAYDEKESCLVYAVAHGEETVSAFIPETEEIVNLGVGEVNGNLFYSKTDKKFFFLDGTVIRIMNALTYYAQGLYRIVETKENIYRIFNRNTGKEVKEPYFFCDKLDYGVSVLSRHSDWYEVLETIPQTDTKTRLCVDAIFANAYLLRVGYNGNRCELYCFKDDKPYLLDSGWYESCNEDNFKLGNRLWKVDYYGTLIIPKTTKKWWQFWK